MWTVTSKSNWKRQAQKRLRAGPETQRSLPRSRARAQRRARCPRPGSTTPPAANRPRESPHRGPGATDPREAPKDAGPSLASSAPASRTAQWPGQGAPFVRPPAPLGPGRPRGGGAPGRTPERGSQGPGRPGPRYARARVGESTDACNSRLPSFARSAILLPQPRPQCIARPDGTAHGGPRGPRTPRFTAAPGWRRACAEGGAVPGGLAGSSRCPIGLRSVPSRFCCSERAVWAASALSRSLRGPRWPHRSLRPADCVYRGGPILRSGANCPRVSVPCAALPSAPPPVAAEPRRAGHELFLVPRPALTVPQRGPFTEQQSPCSACSGT